MSEPSQLVKIAGLLIALSAAVTVLMSGPGGKSRAAEPGAAAPATQPPAAAGKWETISEDDFNGDTVDTTKWNISAYGRDNAQFLPANVWQKDGNLVIRTQKETAGKYNYTTGGIESKGKVFLHPDNYGGKVRLEVRAKLPKGKGIWPAFWTLQNEGGWPPEIDIYETLGVNNKIYMTYHWKDVDDGKHKQNGNNWTPDWDYSQDFHNYAVVWTKDSLQWEVDGVVRKTLTDPVILAQLKDQYIIIYTQMGGWDGNWPGDDAVLPAYTYVDWFRASKWVPTPPAAQ